MMPNDRAKAGPAATYTTGGAEAPRTPGAPDAGTVARPDANGSTPGSDAARAGAAPSLLPALTLPTGGGAIRGIGEKLLVNAVTGTASLGIPLPVSPGRGGFGPQIELAYDSGSGNGSFGLGFNLSVPTITRKTDQGLPRYYDGEESDDYVLSGAEDLVPTRDAAGALVEIDRGDYVARRYRPRVEGLFARIERWIHRVTRDVHWRVTTKDNTTHVYGTTSASRIVDPKDERRVFSWLLEESGDDKGNIVRYEYKPEDGAGVDPALLREQSRFEGDIFTATAQRYLKRALYCNATPFVAGDFLMELVFDYGEHLEQPAPNDSGSWTVRPDPFSSYRATFEVRTYRLCQRVLMFHRLSADRAPLLVKSTQLTYDANPSFTYLTGVTQRGHLFESGVWQTAELPTLELDYTRAVLNDQLSVLSAESLEGLAGGVDGARKQWVDLDGEGIPGVLIDSDSAWYYKSNRGGGKLDPPRVLPTVPSPARLAGGVQQLEDLGGDGQLDLISYDPMLSGYFSRTPEGGFEPLRAFQALPNIDFGDPNLRFIDLDGDGHGDLLLTEEHAFVWYRSKAKGGFDLAERLVVPEDEDQGPAVVFADPEQSIQLADMSGDGLVDIVRVRDGQVSYWPNLGHGRFGKKVTLENSPTFAGPEAFDARRVRFGDVDGSGTSDLFYLGADGISLFRNESGNRLGAPERIRSLPPVDGLSQLSIVDLLGQGTACLVWSSPLPSPTRPLLYVDLMGGIKPHLMRSVVNNLGAETRLTYAASTKFYLADKAAGTPWLTRLAFPVQVLERIERVDAVSKSRLVSTYSYHHGYFDGVEREFRGFARVEQRDAEEFSTGSPDTALDQPPTRTVSWFHTGAWLEKERMELALQQEYFQGGPPQFLLPDATLLPDNLEPQRISIQDEREATRALRGRLLRQEVYADDGTDSSALPYLITEQSFAVRRLQPSESRHHGVFFSQTREAVTIHAERASSSPRVSHDSILDVDEFGNVTRQAAISYARPSAPYTEQTRAWVTVTERDFVNRPNESDWYRVGVQFQQRTWELTGLPLPDAGQGLIEPGTLRAAIALFPPESDLPYEASPGGTAPQRRLIEHGQQLFYRNDLAGPLVLGEIESLALPYESYQLALTTGLVQQLISESQALTGTPLDPAILLSEARYVQRDTNYWAPSGRVLFNPVRFYLPMEAIDPFDGHFFVTYDDFALLVTSSGDPLGNVVQVVNDYRVLAPSQLTDPNLNRTAVAFNELGMVVRTAVMGKGAGEGDTLEAPTTRVEYDLLRWQRGEPTGGRRPAFVHTFAREEHGPENPRFLESFTYSDGFGRVAMHKVQAEEGPAPLRNANGELQRDANGDLVIGPIPARWVGTGRTIFNNKGNPVKQYEPFFSSTSEYEDESDLVDWGVTPVIHYDPLDRVIRTQLPNGTERRVLFDAWQQTNLDQNDTVLDSSWYADRGSPHPSAPEPGDPEQRAAWLTARHAGTPTVAHLDTLGRVFLSVAHDRTNGADRFFETRTQLDIEGNALAITDARGVITIRQRFDVLARRIRAESPDAGTRLRVSDAAGKALRGWDSRGQTTRARYDVFQRPTHAYVRQGASERLLLRTVYGEALDPAGQPPASPPVSVAQQSNLRGRAYQVYDCAGLATNVSFDFKGNLLHSTRRLAVDYQGEPSWIAAEGMTDPDDILAQVELQGLLNSETFSTTATYDALNRVRSQVTPDGSSVRAVYNEANLLEQLHVSVRGGTERPVITGMAYNARGQRTLCEYANGTSTSYAYDAETFRLTLLETVRTSPSAILQRLLYTYDPVGNIVELRDRADIAPLFSGTTPESGDGKYEYDAIYRLVYAEGREHPGGQTTDLAPPPGTVIPHPNDLQALLRYSERYIYDDGGNLLQIAHDAGLGSWTRNYQYGAASNRLQSTSVPGSPLNLSAFYTYDNHGSMTSMPHLPVMEWDYADRLQHVNKGGGGDVYFNYDGAGERVRKVYVHSGLVEERIYLGGFEIYRRHVGALGPAPNEERETLHINDDQQRVAMLETKTREGGSAISTPTTRWRFQLDNHLGSALLELDEAGSIISYEEYHPYGSTAFHTARGGAEVSAKRYRYTGKERDDETGLYYHGARYLAPWLGRWTAADPLGIAAPGQSDLNVYAYVRNSPIGRSDPTGLQATEDQAAGFRPVPESLGGLQAVREGNAYSVYRLYSDGATDVAHQVAVVFDDDPLVGKRKGSTPKARKPEPVEDTAVPGPEAESALADEQASGEGSTEAEAATGDQAASAGEAASSFAVGFAKGAAVGLGFIALGAVSAPAALILGGGLALYGLYHLATGGYRDVAASAERLVTGNGTAADYEAAGGLLGGIATGRLRAPKGRSGGQGAPSTGTSGGASTGPTKGSIAAQVMGRLWRYPRVIDPRTGRTIPFPTGNLAKVPKSQRVSWGANERAAFIRDWHQRGYETPRGGWDKYDIHHIHPRELGGQNNFWNLVPVARSTHQQLFNSFWRDFL